MSLKRFISALSVLLLAAVPAACSMHGQSAVPSLSGSGQNGIQPLDLHGGIANRMDVNLQDAALVIDGKQLAHFNVAIREIDVKSSKGKSIVIAQYSTPYVIDVLQYQDGQGAPVGSAATSDQTYTQTRFVIDTGASQAIFADGSTAPLDFAHGDNNASDAGAGSSTHISGAGPGLVAITDDRQFTIGAGAQELVNVDFNLFESLAPEGATSGGIRPMDLHGGISSNTLLVQPTFFVSAGYSSGSILGHVANANGAPVVNATVVAVGPGNVVGNSASTDAAGNFAMHSLAAGLYRLDVYNQYTNAAGAHFNSSGASSSQRVIRGNNINVTPGNATSAGTIND